MQRTLNIAGLLALALGAESAAATTFMCGESIIDDEQLVPATAAEVLAACGEPTSKAGGQWVYEKQGQLTRILEFDTDGNLQSISARPAGD
jgi:hypothetical protein